MFVYACPCVMHSFATTHGWWHRWRLCGAWLLQQQFFVAEHDGHDRRHAPTAHKRAGQSKTDWFPGGGFQQLWKPRARSLCPGTVEVVNYRLFVCALINAPCLNFCDAVFFIPFFPLVMCCCWRNVEGGFLLGVFRYLRLMVFLAVLVLDLFFVVLVLTTVHQFSPALFDQQQTLTTNSRVDSTP